jgi:hypothetical protein
MLCYVQDLPLVPLIPLVPLVPLAPLFPLFPLFPLSTYLEPSSCVRTRPPLLPDARKLTPSLLPSVTLLPSPTQNPDPWGFPDLNIHHLGRHCELLQKIRNSFISKDDIGQ